MEDGMTATYADTGNMLFSVLAYAEREGIADLAQKSAEAARVAWLAALDANGASMACTLSNGGFHLAEAQAIVQAMCAHASHKSATLSQPFAQPDVPACCASQLAEGH
jgi:hypothetical protein